jgi:glucokinase
VAAAAEAGDEAVRDALNRAAQYLAIGIVNVVVTLHPELIVIGGGVAEMGSPLLDAVRLGVRQRVRMVPTEGLRIERSLLGDRAGVLGAVALAAQGGIR